MLSLKFLKFCRYGIPLIVFALIISIYYHNINNDKEEIELKDEIERIVYHNRYKKFNKNDTIRKNKSSSSMNFDDADL